MLENGGFMGLIIGVLICAILTVLLVLENKKIKQELNAAMEKMPKENIEKLKNSGFQEYAENNKFFTGTSIVSEIKQDSDKIKIKVMFYNGFWNEYVINSVSMDKTVYEQKNLQVGDFVKTLHNRDKEGRLKVKEIL